MRNVPSIYDPFGPAPIVKVKEIINAAKTRKPLERNPATRLSDFREPRAVFSLLEGRYETVTARRGALAVAKKFRDRVDFHEPLRSHVYEDGPSSRPRLTLLVAPAGWGKTTVARALAQRWERVAYCDAYGVTDASDLAGRLLTELSRVAPPDVATRLKLSVEAGAAHRIDSAIAAWRSDDGTESVTIFDNLEQAAIPDALRLLDALFDRPHPTRSAILCSRTPLRVRTTRYAAPHETRLLGREDLRLRRDDIERIFGEVPSTAILDRIEETTQGWAIGVFYLARAARAQSLERAVAELAERGTGSLDAYLTNEVIETMAPNLREALVICAAIGDCTSADLARVLGLSEDAALDVLEQLPFVSRRPATETFEVHPLVRTLALRHARRDAAAVLEPAARAALGAGDELRAAELSARCGQLREAAAAIAATGGYVVSAPSARLSSVIGLLDDATLAEFPYLWSASIYARTYTRGIFKRLDEGRRLWHELDEGSEIGLRAAILNVYVDGCGVSGLLDEAESALEQFERSLREHERPFGSLVLAVWRAVLSVWRSRRVDMDAVAREIAPVLAVDATNALYQHNVAVHWHREHGDRAAEAAAHASGIEAAARAGLPLCDVLVWGEAAFSHWFWGDDAAYANAVARLEAAAVPSVYQGTRFVLACMRGIPGEPIGLENHKNRVNACLIGAASVAESEDALRLARLGVETADALRYPQHRILARIAYAALLDGERRNSAVDEAVRIAAGIDSEPLRNAVAAFARGADDLGMLSAFVRRYAQARAAIEVRVFSQCVARDGATLALPERLLEMVMALGLHRSGLSRERFADWIWPQSSSAEGQGALRTSISRLRRILGTEAIISTSRGYMLAPSVRVDLEDAERTLSSIRMRDRLDAAEVERLDSIAGADIDDIVSRTARWDWFEPSLQRLEAIAREAALVIARDALASERWTIARLYASRLLERDERDVTARELLTAAQQQLNVSA